MELGAELRRIREKRGADLAQVAQATKIGIRHLEALERDDFAALPDEVFVRGFIRAYAAFLGEDASRLLAAYQGGSSAADRTMSEMSRLLEARRPARPGRRRVGIKVGLFAGLAVVATGVALLLQTERAKPVQTDFRHPLRASRQEPSIAGPPATPIPVPAAPAPAPIPVPPTAHEPASVVHPPAARQIDSGEAKVAEHGVGTSVQKGVLQGAGDHFPPGSAVWFWTRVTGARGGDVVHHVWIHEGKDVHSTSLRIGSADWRTQSSKGLRSTGHWAVEARDESGRVLARDEFECAPVR